MALFGKDEDRAQEPRVDLSIPPTDTVMAMRNQGLSNNQIIQSLQRQGYDSGIILDAMNQADLKQRISKVPEPDVDEPLEPVNKMQLHGGPAVDKSRASMSEPAPLGFREDNSHKDVRISQGVQSQPKPVTDMPPPPDMPPLIEDPEYPQSTSSSYDPYGPESNYASPSAYPNDTMSSHVVEQISIERIEEIAEAIIDEKWNEIVRSINKIVDWKDRTETKIAKIEQKFVDLRREFENLNKGVLGKIGEYDRNLGDLGVEIKAMEKVFQNIIPKLTENVHSLEKITSELRNDD